MIFVFPVYLSGWWCHRGYWTGSSVKQQGIFEDIGPLFGVGVHHKEQPLYAWQIFIPLLLRGGYRELSSLFK
jgi:hypothetical protein